MKNRQLYIRAAFILALGLMAGLIKAQTATDRSWSVYKGNEGSTNYSPLTQLTAANVSQLQPAWTLMLKDKPVNAAPGKSECNPIIVDGVLYASSPIRQPMR